MTHGLKKRVLVVDDESIIRSFLAEGLTDVGYEVLTADNGAAALEAVQLTRPDAVLLDLLMPVMDGWAFLRARQERPQLASMPVVVLSAGGTEPLREASSLRATAVLAKPLNLDVLAAVLEHVLREVTVQANALDLKPDVAAGHDVGRCPICGVATFAVLDATLLRAGRLRAIQAARLAHVLAHSAGDIARVPLRNRLLQLPAGRRRILADWVYRELRQEWGDRDRVPAHSIEEALDSTALHRLWQDAENCWFPSCNHGG